MRFFLVFLAAALIAVGAWLTREQWWPLHESATATSGVPVTSAPATGVTTQSPAPRSLTPQGLTPQSPTPAAGQLAANVTAQSAATVTAATAAASTQQQAEKFVATLTEPDPAPVTIERADHFVTGAQMLSLIPREAVQSTTIDALRDDPTLSADMPITVVREVEQLERITPEKLIAQSAGNLDAPIQILENNQVLNTTVREVLERARRAPQAPIDLITRTEYFEQTTTRELVSQAEQEGGDRSSPIKVIRKHHGLEASSIADLMRRQGVKSGSLFYVRTVREGDEQGIWGIVHDGIIDNFARGMAIRRGKEINTYRVDIPTNADEQRPDASSSYLGRLIYNKSKASYVYNFNRNRMGRNPDRIFPGQEIVIIDFQPEELIEIYTHFVEQRG